ncbi:hypothetical protein PR048_026576 [Dryococelus australis]|uniref:Uncharacterized protein n=1 Tax=Dryococelus australis TaxID=614101 RepID=A0ABQ9GLS0_9NEOP|nr:hypothetical protein PR048_026576 [Dryococelus australis]
MKVREKQKEQKTVESQLFKSKNTQNNIKLQASKNQKKRYNESSIEEDWESKEANTISIGDRVRVVYRSKTSVRRCVGLMIGVLSFAPHIEGSKFKWPDCEDISAIDDKQIERKLSPPKFQEKKIESHVLFSKKKLKGSVLNKSKPNIIYIS